MNTFHKRVDMARAAIGAYRLTYNASESAVYEEAYTTVQRYAYRRELLNTALALPVVRSLHDGLYRGTVTLADGETVQRPYLCHCLSVCMMLINLHLQLTAEEEDILLAAALCHDLPAYVPEIRHSNVLTERYGIAPEVTEVVERIYTRECRTDEDFERVFAATTESKLASLVKIADRGNVVEQLHDVSVWRAHEYIHETRSYYLPLCIHTRENYPELDRPVRVLQEKLRDLIEAAEMFVTRYTDLETDLSTQILALEEENARMRMRIRNAK